MLRDEYSKTVQVQQLADDESGDGESYVTTIESVKCHIQPLDDGFSQDLEGNFGKDAVMFCCDNDIAEGDLIIDGSVKWKVVGVERYFFLGRTRHMELRIRRSLP